MILRTSPQEIPLNIEDFYSYDNEDGTKKAKTSKPSIDKKYQATCQTKCKPTSTRVDANIAIYKCESDATKDKVYIYKLYVNLRTENSKKIVINNVTQLSLLRIIYWAVPPQIQRVKDVYFSAGSTR